MKSLLVNMKTQQKQKISDSTKGMSSSLLGTLQTDWITGRSLETVVFCFAAIVEAFAAAWGLRDSPEIGSDDSKNEREWRTRRDKTRESNTYTTVGTGYGQGDSILSPPELVRWHCVALLAPTQARPENEEENASRFPHCCYLREILFT